MPRHPRDYFLSDFLHVMVQGDQKKYIFKSDVQKNKYLNYMLQAASQYDVKTVAYCIMGNHAHILVYSRIIENISKMFHQCNTSYGIFYNKTQKTVGHVFRDRYKSENIDTEKHLINCIRYIHQNPVKARICKTSDAYPFSSYYEFKNLKRNCMVGGVFFSEDDLNEILQETPVVEEFIDDEDKEINFEKIIRMIKKKETNGVLKENDMCSLYLSIKEKWKISDDKIAELFHIDRSKLRRLLIKQRIK